MKTKTNLLIAVLVLGLAASATAATAQDNSSSSAPTASQGQPDAIQSQPSAPPVAGTTAEEGTAEPEAATPDTRPLTGAERFTLGSFGTERSFLTTDLHFFQYVQNFPVNSTESTTDATALVGTDLHLQRTWRHAAFGANYSGGYNFYESSNVGQNSYYHQFGISQSFTFRRATLTFLDSGNYSPGSAFGYLGINGYGASNINLGYLPNQSILTGYGAQYTNTVVGQVSYLLSRRSSVNFAGSFGVLRSSGIGFVDSNQYSANAGYNYQLGPKDTIGITYRFDRFGYSDPGLQSFDTHSVQAAYGRRITGRIGLQLSGGPQFRTSGDAAGLQTGWTASSALTYAFRSATLSVTYLHSVTGGAGVFLGANSDIVTGGISRALSRTISGSLTAGYSRNSSLSQSASASSDFSGEYVQVGIAHPVGRQASLSFNYNLQHQSTDSGICAGTLCLGSWWQHALGVGVQWHMHPILLGR